MRGEIDCSRISKSTKPFRSANFLRSRLLSQQDDEEDDGNDNDNAEDVAGACQETDLLEELGIELNGVSATLFFHSCAENECNRGVSQSCARPFDDKDEDGDSASQVKMSLWAALSLSSVVLLA